MFETTNWTKGRVALSSLIAARLHEQSDALREGWHGPHRVRSCLVDDLLPMDILQAIHRAFPAPERMPSRRPSA